MEFRVICRTSRFNETCRFYGDALGWPVTREWSDHGRGRIFGYGDVGRIEVLEREAAAPLDGVLLSVEDDDVRALHQRLVAAGVEVFQGITEQTWGHINFGVRDPNGLELMFFQRVAGAGP